MMRRRRFSVDETTIFIILDTCESLLSYEFVCDNTLQHAKDGLMQKQEKGQVTERGRGKAEKIVLNEILLI